MSVKENIRDFFTDRMVLKNFMYMAIAVVLIFLIVYIGLRIYTKHGQAVYVPNFIGMSIAQAEQRAKSDNLEIVIIDSVFSAPVKRGCIVDQTPPPRFKVKENRKIFITIKAFTPEKIAMPNLIGSSLIQAKADLETFGLRIGKITYKPDIAKDNVLEQLFNGKPIAPGEPVEKGSAIDLVLGIGLNGNFAIVPNFLGLGYEEANSEAIDNSINIGSVIYDESVKNSSDSINAIIYKQVPNARSVLPLGGQVDIWLTVDTKKAFGEDNE